MLTSTIKKILKTRAFELSNEEIESIMNSELKKEKGEMDTEVVDMCLEIITKDVKAIKRENLTFGEVIDLLTHNEKGTIKAARVGWFDDIAFIVVLEHGVIIKQKNTEQEVMLDPYIAAVTPDSHYRIGWKPTQVDMFADDWYIMTE